MLLIFLSLIISTGNTETQEQAPVSEYSQKPSEARANKLEHRRSIINMDRYDVPVKKRPRSRIRERLRHEHTIQESDHERIDH